MMNRLLESLAHPRQVPVARLALVLLAGCMLLPLVRMLPDRGSSLPALKLVVGALSVGLMPGVVLLLVLRLLRRGSLLECLGLGMALSFGITQLLTMVGMLAHVSCFALTLAAWLGCVAGAALVWRSASDDWVLEITPGESVVMLLIGLLSVATFRMGSEFSWAQGEDGIHIAVIRRLAALDEPALDNIYWAPNIVYTYPFPATHYFFAQVCQASGLDPFLVYQKMRFFWAIGATTFVYLAARLVFPSARLAVITAGVATLFALNGSFAQVGQYSWAQLVPLSHASDVAMNVYLPALIVLTLYYLRAPAWIDTLAFFTMCMLLTFLLTVVHIREVVQHVVYLGSFLAALLLFRRDRRLLLRTLGLLGAILLLVVAYITWHKHAVGHIDTFVQERKEMLATVARTLPWRELLWVPFANDYFICNDNSFFLGWFPVVLLASPLLAWAFRKQDCMLLVGASIFGYFLIVRLPLLTIPYVYFTYFEILFTPVRNVVFFVYLLAGPLFYLLAVHLSRLPRWYLRWPAALGTAALLVLAYRRGFDWFWPAGQQHLQLGTRADSYFLTVLALFALVFFIARRRLEQLAPLEPEPAARRWAPVFVILVAVATWGSWLPASSPVAIALSQERKRATSPTDLQPYQEENAPFPYNPADPTRMSANPTIRTPRAVSCPPSPALMKWANAHLSPQSVLAINLLNRYSPALFLPQQFPFWPHVDTSTGGYFRRIFPDYYDMLEASLARHQAQPFFNSRESLEERLTYVQRLHITHVLVDPMYHDEMTQVLARWPEHFVRQFDDGRWSLYAVAPAARSTDGAPERLARSTTSSLRPVALP